MPNNLIISYDLHNPGQNYHTTIERIKSLGTWAKIHASVWYVKSNYSAGEARDLIWAVMDSNDTVFVADATNDQAAWQNLSNEVANFLVQQWGASDRSRLSGG